MSHDIFQQFRWRSATACPGPVFGLVRETTVQVGLDGCHEQAVRPVHHFPVVLVSRSTTEAYLIVTSAVVNARPRETVCTTLTKEQLEEFHELT
jgi:hypothetical protein